MGEVIELWPHRAMNEALEALDEFGKTGSREIFKKWKEKYGNKIEQEKVAILNILTGEGNGPEDIVRPTKALITDAGIMKYKEWYTKHAGEIWVMYHEQDTDYASNYEEWCEKQYNKYLEGGV